MKPLQYIPWFDVQLSHAYFNHSMAKCFNIIPNQATKDFEKQQRVAIKATNGSLAVMINKEFSSVASAEDKDAPGLVFDLEISDALFMNYTALPDHAPETVAYFTNATGRNLEANPDTGHQPTAQDWVRVFSPSFSLALDDENTTASISRVNGNEIPSAAYSVENGVLKANLSAFGEGGYVLTIGSTTETICIRNPRMSMLPMAVIEVFPEYIPAASTTYSLAFEANFTHWKYNVMGQSISFEDFDLSIDDASETFLGPEDVLVMRQQARQFSSVNKIALSERPTLALQLTATPKTSHSGLRKIELKLPSPSPTSVRLSAGPEPALISEMYVYV